MTNPADPAIATPTASSEWPIPGLPATLAVHHLAVLGVARLLRDENATIHHAGATPVLRLDVAVTLDELVDTLTSRALHEVTHPPVPIQTNQRARVNTYLRDTWGSPDPAFGLRIDSSAVADPTKYVQGTRFAAAVNHPLGTKMKAFSTGGDDHSHYAPLVRTLFEDAAPHATPRKGSLLGFSPTDDSEDVRYSGETKYLYEAAELLAGAVVAYLPPRATFPDPDHAGTHRWLRWHLNTTPMAWTALLALARRPLVPGLVTYEAELKAGSSGKYYRYTLAMPVTPRSNRIMP